MKDAESLARNNTAEATSSVVPMRPIGTCSVSCFLTAGPSSLARPRVRPKIGVSIRPGLIVLTRIQRPTNSAANERPSPHRAALLAQYAVAFETPLCAATELVITTADPLDMSGNA